MSCIGGTVHVMLIRELAEYIGPYAVLGFNISNKQTNDR